MYADDKVFNLDRPNAEQLEVDCFAAINMAVQYWKSNDLAGDYSKAKQLILGRQKSLPEDCPSWKQPQQLNI